MIQPPPGESVSGEFYYTLYGIQGKIYRVKKLSLVIGRSSRHNSLQRCDLGIGQFKNISREHACLTFRKDEKVVQLKGISGKQIKVNKHLLKRDEIFNLSNNDVIYLGSSYVTISVDYNTLRNFSFKDPLKHEREEEGENEDEKKVSWFYESPAPSQNQLSCPTDLDLYTIKERKWEIDITEPPPRFRAPIICEIKSDRRKKKFYHLYTPCDYGVDEKVGFNEHYKPPARGRFSDIRTFLSWSILKMMTWNIRPGDGYLDPRIEYGCTIEKTENGTYIIKERHSEEIEKWDLIYIALRFFQIKDLICLGTIKNLRNFVKMFFKKSQVEKWRQYHRPIGRELLEQIFVGIDEINAHRKLLSFQMMYSCWKEVCQQSLLECAKDRCKQLDQWIQKYENQD